MKSVLSVFTPVRCALSAALLSAFVAGCSTTPAADQAANKGPAPVANAGGSNTGAGTGVGSSGSGVTTVTPQNNAGKAVEAAAKLPRVIYFDFDSFVIKDEFLRVVEVNAKALSSDRNRRLVIEGHADERGSREYNLALGQKRAEAVVKSMTVLGASPKQLEAVSFGEERPAAIGAGESVWAQNRRAELNTRQ